MRSAPRRSRRRGPARTWHERTRTARERAGPGGRGRAGGRAVRELWQRGHPALLRRLRAALGGSGALPVALLAGRHRGPDARGLTGVAHAVGTVVQAGVPDERIPRRPPGALLAAGTTVPRALR